MKSALEMMEVGRGSLAPVKRNRDGFGLLGSLVLVAFVWQLLSRSPSRHDRRVLELAKELNAEGWSVWADINGWRQPRLLNCRRPDIYARRGWKTVAIEVETSRSVHDSHSKAQDAAFRRWEEENPCREYVLDVVAP